MSQINNNQAEEEIIHTIKENGRMILYALDWCNMFGYKSIDNSPLRFNPLTVDNCEITKVRVNRYDAARVGKGPCYQVWFKMWNTPKPISGEGPYAVWDTESFREYSSCLLIPVKDFVAIMREVKLMSIGVK